MRDYREIINGMFEELVPASGKAPTVAGELVRAVCRIAYRWYNDGDVLGVDYGKETVDPAGRYLIAKGNKAIRDAVCDAWGMDSEKLYEMALEVIEGCVVEFIEENPGLRDVKNDEDMFDYATDEDVWEDETEDFGYWGEDPLYDEDDDFGEDYYDGWAD